MSYILDALKQSERRRNSRTMVSGPVSPAEISPPPTLPFYRRRGPWLLLILLLALPLGIGLGRFGAGWLGLSSAPEAIIPPPGPVAATPDAPMVIASHSPRILLEAPPAVSLNGSEPGPTPRPQQATAPPPPVPAEETRTPEPVFDPGVPDLRMLPASIRSRLPTLTLSVHIYASDPAARMVNINGQMVREGQSAAGLTVQRITPKGVILNFEGSDFHLYSIGG
ncbi:hypothetical protein GU3_02190 [Oceanimonas sp. GK1]|uniref:general secretion pathway protein GspB n=1 Tax=Oceanimonas sp. (strain GK1 / IBRC-M 10197) TaxID=511062 RepID=UPI0002494B21|nr:general secretion pathway protein GspB [Oceanimonas sp. GK1]AEY00195.1 hypothetical protein GU3_02190 [Oceanimonas sp. GK1]